MVEGGRVEGSEEGTVLIRRVTLLTVSGSKLLRTPNQLNSALVRLPGK